MQISIYVINNMPEPGRNLAADACMGRTQLSPCIYNFSTRTIRASRNAMPAWYFFHAEPLISRFSLEKYITLLQQLWQTILMWNLYPIFISLNQLAVKITPAESFLWMHLHQFQYLYNQNTHTEQQQTGRLAWEHQCNHQVWCQLNLMTSSNAVETFSTLLALCAGNSPVSGEFPTQRPVTRNFDVFFDLRLNKWLSKHSRCLWFETQLSSLWCHCN